MDAAKHGEGTRLAERSGGATNYFTTNDRKYAKEAISDILAGRGKAAQFWNKIKHPLRTLQDIIEVGEMAGRVAEFKKTLKQLGNSEEAVNKAVYNMRDISVDFKRMGRWIRKYNANRLINFFNSNVQGIDKLLRMFSTKNLSRRTIWRSLLYLTLPTLFLAWMCRDNENYDDLPWYRKDFFWNIPLGDPATADTFISLPRPWELGLLFATIPERLFSQAYHDDPTAWDGFGQSIFDSMAPDLMPSAIEPFFYDATGKKWNGIPILNSQDERFSDTRPDLQYNKYTSEVSKTIAGFAANLPYAPGWLKSPKRLDQIITGYTGSLGSIALDSIDQALGTKEGIPILSGLSEGFITDSSRSPRSSDDFYDYKARLDSDYAVYLVTGEAPEGYNPAVRSVFTKVNSELSNLKKKQTAIEALPNSPEKEQLLDELRAQEITLMRAANAIYEKVYSEK